MKTFTLLTAFLYFTITGFAQTADTAAFKHSDDPNIIYTKVEVEAGFPGGQSAWGQYLGNNLNGDVPYTYRAPIGVYKVQVQFVVSKDGSVIDILPLTNLGYGMEQEVMRVLANSPKWIPATQNGRNVNAYRIQPITFKVDSVSQTRDSIHLRTGDSILVEAAPPKDWVNYIGQNLDVSIPVKKGADPENYKVAIKFTVATDGSVTNVEALTNLGFGMEEEAIRVIKNSPKWTPASINGRPVVAYRIQQLVFEVQ